MFSYLRLLAIAIFIIAVSMSNQRVDALALPAPALIPRGRDHDSSPPSSSQDSFAGPGGNAQGGSVNQSNEGSTVLNVLSNDAGAGGFAGSVSGTSHGIPHKSSSECGSCESQHNQRLGHPASTNGFPGAGGQVDGGYGGAEHDHGLIGLGLLDVFDRGNGFGGLGV